MRVKEITLTTSPTVVVANDYIKAGASITMLVDEGEEEEAIATGTKLLNKAYKHALLAELRNVTSIQKRESRKVLIAWLKKDISNGKEESDTKKSEKEQTQSGKRRRRVRRSD